jgi:hypothetical protein
VPTKSAPEAIASRPSSAVLISVMVIRPCAFASATRSQTETHKLSEVEFTCLTSAVFHKTKLTRFATTLIVFICRPKWLVRLIQLQLRDGSRKNFNQRGKKIEAMLVGSRDRNACDLPLEFGEHRREKKYRRLGRFQVLNLVCLATWKDMDITATSRHRGRDRYRGIVQDGDFSAS